MAKKCARRPRCSVQETRMISHYYNTEGTRAIDRVQRKDAFSSWTYVLQLAVQISSLDDEDEGGGGGGERRNNHADKKKEKKKKIEQRTRITKERTRKIKRTLK
jgi:hypothetical protein